MTHMLVVGHPEQTGDAVYVSEIEQLAEFKSADTVYSTGGVYTFPVPIVFTSPIIDFGDCRIELAGGSLKGFAPGDPAALLAGKPVGQIITASTLDPAVPFLTGRRSVYLERITIFGVGVAFDLDGTTAGPLGLVDWFEVVVLDCQSLGTISDYALTLTLFGCVVSGSGSLTIAGAGTAVIMQRTAFNAMSGGLVFGGAFGGITIERCQFWPLDGVTAIATVAATLVGVTFEVSSCVFVLELAGSVGMKIDATTALTSEGLIVDRAGFTRLPVGVPSGPLAPPVGVPLAPGSIDATWNEARFTLCANTPNSTTAVEITMKDNAIVTDVGGGTDPVLVGGPTIERRASKFSTGPHSFKFLGGIDTSVRVEGRAVVGGASNKDFKIFLAYGTEDTVPPVPVAVVDFVVAPGSTGSGSTSSQVTVSHTFDFVAGEGGVVQLWMSTDGTNLVAEATSLEGHT